ncbi:rac GTPase-activating protein 1-like isoform X2 [Liolophura sinensis]|uniref:rac GTPase-activating protein 1-like isoform X2 n=1 Tax=Liolophura sinensis TaxID=3198878 RepID=UPI0031598917
MDRNRLSIVAAFDDLIRNTRVLTQSVEPEFVKFVRSEEECRRKWHDAEIQCDKLRRRVKEIDQEKLALDTQLRHARKQIALEVDKRMATERELDSAERQLCLIRELLNDRNHRTTINEEDMEKLYGLVKGRERRNMHEAQSPYGGLESSASILSDIYDQTDDDLERSRRCSGLRYKKRPSAPPLDEDEDECPTPPKMGKNAEDADNSFITTTTITVDRQGNPVTAKTEVTVPKLNKSLSEPALDIYREEPDRDTESDPESEDYLWTPNRNNNAMRYPRGILKRTPSEPETPVLRKATSASKGLNRGHVFDTRNIFKPETCVPCGKKIGFGRFAVKCKDCRATCHPDCKDLLPLPCVPNAPSTPATTTRNFVGVISDYVSNSSPMIPALVVHCIREIEKRGMHEVGIYRVPGSTKQVRELKEKFLKGKVPNLSHVDDINVVCGCVKDFLLKLKEPLITYRMWQEFVDAATDPHFEHDRSRLCIAVKNLPPANKDTLAFLIVHLQKVSKRVECRMPASNLATVFGPSVVGNSCPDPSSQQMITESTIQSQVVQALMSIPSDYWMSFTEDDQENFYSNPNTPGTPDGVHSVLGSVFTPSTYSRKRSGIKTSYTPRLMPPLIQLTASPVSESQI